MPIKNGIRKIFHITFYIAYILGPAIFMIFSRENENETNLVFPIPVAGLHPIFQIQTESASTTHKPIGYTSTSADEAKAKRSQPPMVAVIKTVSITSVVISVY
jgi:hypothetical protein